MFTSESFRFCSLEKYHHFHLLFYICSQKALSHLRSQCEGPQQFSVCFFLSVIPSREHPWWNLCMLYTTDLSQFLLFYYYFHRLNKSVLPHLWRNICHFQSGEASIFQPMIMLNMILKSFSQRCIVIPLILLGFYRNSVEK